MRLPSFALLWRKELAELFASRAFWLMLLIIGPLVGHAFITAVDSYAEASGIGGGPAALAEGLSPLDGMLVPTFGAYDLAVTLLFPFVAIRMVAADRESGAWKLMLQAPTGLGTILVAKGLALLCGWLIAWVPGLLSLALWRIYGGALYAPEVGNLLLGHLLRVFLGAGVAVAAASIANNASSAAIAALGFTVGTWALDFIAAGRGGLLQKFAAYTPTATLRLFEMGQLRWNTVLVSILLGLTGFVLAATWLRAPRTQSQRMTDSLMILLACGLLSWSAALPRTTWDLSENRRNSFSRAEEDALSRIHRPLHVRVFLAPEDPRLMDLDRSILSKLQRLLPRVDIDYVSNGASGLFASPSEHYGEVWYELGGRKTMSRSTTEAIVLQTLFELAGVATPLRSEEGRYSGHPLKAKPSCANWVFYLGWPVLVSLAWWYRFRERT